MVDRRFRRQIGETDWDALRLSVALVCRDAIPAAGDHRKWASLASMLGRIGTNAAGLESKDDLALRVLADFADEATCRRIIGRTRALVAELPEPVLRAMTEKAAAIVERACPDQSFRFKATLVLVSMIVSQRAEESALFDLAERPGRF